MHERFHWVAVFVEALDARRFLHPAELVSGEMERAKASYAIPSRWIPKLVRRRKGYQYVGYQAVIPL